MNKDLRNNLLKNLSDSESGIALKEYIIEKIKELDSVSNIDSLEEMLGRKIAIKKLKEIFKSISLLKEKDIKKTSYQ